MRIQRAVIIGLGNIGYKFSLLKNKFLTTHFEAYKNNPHIQLVAVADHDKKILASFERQKKISVYHNYQELLDREQPEIVSICTPDATHYEILKSVIRTPSVRGIWCEKPLAISLDEARRMVKSCEDKKIALAVNFIRRYDPLYQYIQQNSSTILGEIQAANFMYSGGIVTTGAHMFDLLFFLLGECHEVSGEQTSTGIIGRLRFGTIWVNILPLKSTHYSIFELSLFGSMGQLDLINKPFGEYDYRFIQKQYAPRINSYFLANKQTQPLKKLFPRTYMADALVDLLKSVTERRPPLSSGATALHSLEIMHALLFSAEHGGMKVILPFNKKVRHLPTSGGDIKK